MGCCCWRTWPCTPCSSARASLTPTRPGGASTVGESQPTTEDPEEEAGERTGGGSGRGGSGVGWCGRTAREGRSAQPHPGPCPFPTSIPREVISSKEKSKYKFPPAALPSEFSAFFRGQAPPLPLRPHLAPPPNLSPFLQFPIPEAGGTGRP